MPCLEMTNKLMLGYIDILEYFYYLIFFISYISHVQIQIIFFHSFFNSMITVLYLSLIIKIHYISRAYELRNADILFEFYREDVLCQNRSITGFGN